MIILYAGLALCSLVGGIFVWQEVGDDPSHPRHKKPPVVTPGGPTAPIPEPSTWAMMAVGGAVVVYAIKKNKS